MGKPLHRAVSPGWVVALAVCLVAAAVPVAAGGVAVAKPSAVSSKLVGRWTRTITAADIKRSYGYGNTPGSVCTLVIKKNGTGHFAVAGVGAWDGKVVVVGADRIHVTWGDLTGNVYRWRVSGRLLTLTKVYDGISDRATAMWGVWKRK